MSKITNEQIWNKLLEIEQLLKKNNKISDDKSIEKTIEKSGKIIIDKYTNLITIKGDSYEKKTVIKKYSGYWSGEKKIWIISKSEKIDPFIKEIKKQAKEVIVNEIQDELDIETNTKVIKVEKLPELNNNSFINDD